MFERFTERARQVVVLAQEEARALGHNYIGTEHLLLGLFAVEDGLAARVLVSLGITAEDSRAQVVRIVGHGEGPVAGQIPFTPRAKKVLELSMREALALGHNYIGTEHVLLGIAREGKGVAARILAAHGADAERVRETVMSTLVLPSRPAPTDTGRVAGLARRRFAGQRPSRWSYRVAGPFGTEELTEELLAQHGAEGWELVALVGPPDALRAVFKRPGRA